MHGLYDLLYILALLVGWPWLIYRRLTRGPGSLALGERLTPPPSRPVASQCVWIHGVSLGEINATRTLVAALRLHAPTAVVVVSSTTATGLSRARELYPKLINFRFPLDFSFVLRRVFERVRPSIIVLMELELWPNLLEVAHARGVPVVIANGRVTHERSVRRFNHLLIRPFARRMFARLSWVGAQDATYAGRFSALGTPSGRIDVTGSMKYDAADITDHIDGQEQLAEEMGIDPRRPLWVCGSTGPGEEAAILDAYSTLLEQYADLQLAIVPRKPERFDQVADLIVQRGFACLRRSGGKPAVPRNESPPRPVFLGDTMGELRKFYALARFVFVGRTLTPLGGSDVMEVAGLRKPMIVGPHLENFAEAESLLRDAGGFVQIQRDAELAGAVEGLLRDPARAEATGAAARGAIESRRGATERTVAKIMMLLQTPAGKRRD